MSILFNEEHNTITINTKNTSYQMRVSSEGFLQHLYYGKRIGEENFRYLYHNYDRACAGNPDEVFPNRAISFDTMPQEFPGYGVGDYRIHAIAARNADGSYGADFRYAGHEVTKGKYKISNLPSSYDYSGDAETLTVTVNDKITGLTLELLYGVFEDEDVITRAVRVVNNGKGEIALDRAFSISMDIPYGKWDLIHFHGKHALERQTEREPLTHLVKSIESRRGTSSHQENPFMIVCDRKADEDHGRCYGMMFVYSGSFKAEAEVDQINSTRVTMGIHDDQFEWHLMPGEVFETPEVIMAYSGEGLTELSHIYHRFIRRNICRGKYQFTRRPILLNSWEASYFDFTDETLLALADEAAKIGVEMLVLDDGWFGDRNSDNAGLGDWYVNENKIKCGLKSLVEQVNAKGLKFGIWMEPEMISPKSKLFEAHPDWAIQIPGREPCRSRNQYVLDLTRKEVRDYIYSRIKEILESANIEYLKWDMNRQLCDLGSYNLASDKQGELSHRYMLAVYELQERLITDFPDLLIENCSGGGARFDAGMLYYSPQIWCSDDTDAIERLKIQEGTSLIFPLSTMGAHVSDCPNHTVGRTTPFKTRGDVALAGTFGYELDITRIPESDRQDIPRQVETYHKYNHLVRGGDYYRLSSYQRNHEMDAYMVVSKDKKEALVTYVQVIARPNPARRVLKLKGLLPDAVYEIEGSDIKVKGATLEKAGIVLPKLPGDHQSQLIHLVVVA
jgi:alpha-galactosidase